ncbi:MAG: hypothetical protein M3R25_01755 [Bacteroidota bacterium]|nr:hypothetical protein [Bacteroidota bacterium]
MKKWIILIAAGFGFGLVQAQTTVGADSLRYFEGKVIKVCEKVSDTFVTKGEKKTTFLSFGYGYPNQLFTVVIFEEDLKNFKYAPAEFLKGKNVCIIGDVRMYNGLAEIIVEREDQILIE